MKTIRRLSCLAVLLVGMVPSYAYADNCSDQDNNDNTHLPALQALINKKDTTPQDYFPYLSSLQTSSSVKFFSGASRSKIPTYFMDSCFSVTENSYGNNNSPIMLLERGCKGLNSKPDQVMVDCSKALTNGICQDDACVVNPKIMTPSPIGRNPERAPKRSMAKRLKDATETLYEKFAQVFSWLPKPENPENCQDSDSKKFQTKGKEIKDKASVTTSGFITFKDDDGKTKTWEDKCEDAEEINEAVCFIENNKVTHGFVMTWCDQVCTNNALDPNKPGSLKKVAAHCMPGELIGNNAYEDWDGDGLTVYDNCPTTPNPDQKDSDGDGTGDTCDFDDGDGDGVLDLKDNCPTVANADQQDGDKAKNPAGDACQDTDGDGKIDLQDNCPTMTNPDQLDFNMNNVGDICDDPTTLTALEPNTLPDFSGDNRLSAGMNHTCALFDKKAYCWGSGQYGQIGLGSYDGKYEPAKVVLPKPVYDNASYLGITAGKIHTCGWTDASTYSSKGKVRCWGINKPNIPPEEEADGVLGIDPDYTGSTGTPIQISKASIGYDTEALQISANQNATCAVIQWHSNVICQNTGKYCEFKTPMCWGGPFGKTPTQYPFGSSSNPVKWVATGKNHLCGIVEQGKWGEAWCLGKSDLGQLGDGVSNSATFDATAKKVKLPYVTGKADMASNVIKVIAGKSHSCALMQRGINIAQLKTRLYCWGDNQAGQIPAQGAKQDFYNTPQDLTEELTGETSPEDKWSQVLDVASFDNATCAIVTHTGWPNLEIKCWGGYNYKGIVTISTGNIDDYSDYSQILALTVGGNHACTTHASGKVYCWGKNDYGQLGNNTSDTAWTYDSMTTPQPVTLPKE